MILHSHSIIGEFVKIVVMRYPAINKCPGLLPVPKIMLSVSFEKYPSLKPTEKTQLLRHPICFFPHEFFDDVFADAARDGENKTPVIIGVKAHAAGFLADPYCV